MHRIYYFLSVFFAVFAAYLAFGFAFSGSAQTLVRPQAETHSTPPAAEQSATQAKPVPAPGAGSYRLQSQVPLVVLDVVVTDKKGHPVHGLKASDFTLLEKGEEMTAQSFEEHRSEETAAAPPPPRPVLPPNVFTNYTDTHNKGPLNILLMDALNTPLADQTNVRQQMVRYLKNLPAGTHIAIFGLSNHLYMLQGFTTDPAVLKAVLNSKKGTPMVSPLLSSAQMTSQNNGLTDMVANAASSDPNAQMSSSQDITQAQADMEQFLAEQATFETNLRVKFTLGAINELARYLSALPGRKNLIWFSGSFPIDILPNGDLEDPFGAAVDYKDDVLATADLLTRAQVAVYPVDGRGLFSDQTLTADVGVTQQTPGTRANRMANTDFFKMDTAENSSANLMADQTGGKAFYGTNNLMDAVQKALDQGSNYYTLTYTPANRKWDGTYRSVRVKLDQSGVDLFYRHGYYADDPSAPLAHQQKAPPLSVMDTAMRRGGPDPTQILLTVKIVPAALMDDKLAPLNHPNGKKMKPPYRHYAVYYIPAVRDLAFTAKPDGAHHASLEFITMLYTPNGELMNSTSSAVNFNFPAEKYNELAQRGVMTFLQQIDAPAKGEYFLRIGLHDISTDHVGTVEVPLTAIRAGQAPAPPAAARK